MPPKTGSEVSVANDQREGDYSCRPKWICSQTYLVTSYKDDIRLAFEALGIFLDNTEG
jgi:hypothetical protein